MAICTREDLVIGGFKEISHKYGFEEHDDPDFIGHVLYSNNASEFEKLVVSDYFELMDSKED